MKEEIKLAMLKAPQGHRSVLNKAVELLSYGGEVTLDKLHDISSEVLQSGSRPEEWTQPVFIPIPKKGAVTTR